MGSIFSRTSGKLDVDAGLTDLEKQWMDPHKRKVLEAIDGVVVKCRDNYDYIQHTSEVMRAIRHLCMIIYCSNDYELIQKSHEAFPGLIKILKDPRTSFGMQFEIVGAVSILCQGNQPNTRSWCAEGGMRVLVELLREIPPDHLGKPQQHQATRMNVWICYTLRTLLCGSNEAIKAVVGLNNFSDIADLLVKMFDLKSVWSNTAEGRNYALDCCILLGVGGRKDFRA